MRSKFVGYCLEGKVVRYAECGDIVDIADIADIAESENIEDIV